MAVCGPKHKELDEKGEGFCSVPMWRDGIPDGFCDRPAFGKPPETEWIRASDNRLVRADGRYSGYVPFLACPGHGGPEKGE